MANCLKGKLSLQWRDLIFQRKFITKISRLLRFWRRNCLYIGVNNVTMLCPRNNGDRLTNTRGFNRSGGSLIKTYRSVEMRTAVWSLISHRRVCYLLSKRQMTAYTGQWILMLNALEITRVQNQTARVILFLMETLDQSCSHMPSVYAYPSGA